MTANNSMMMSNILTNVSCLEGKKEKDIFIMWFCLSMQSNCEKLIWFKLITDLELLRESWEECTHLSLPKEDFEFFEFEKIENVMSPPRPNLKKNEIRKILNFRKPPRKENKLKALEVA